MSDDTKKNSESFWMGFIWGMIFFFLLRCIYLAGAASMAAN